ncbi:hypothetical protein ACHAPO_007418 [Fusarium lateritium]
MSNQGDWTGRMHGQHRVCCERCYDNHRSRSACKLTHEGLLIVLGNGSGRPKGAKKGTAAVPALILQGNTFLPEVRMEFEGDRPTDKMLRQERIAIHFRGVAQQQQQQQQQQQATQWQALQGQGLAMQQSNWLPCQNPSMFPNQTQGFQQPGPVSGGMGNSQGYAMPTSADAMGYNMAHSIGVQNQQTLAPVDQGVPLAALGPTPVLAPTAGTGNDPAVPSLPQEFTAQGVDFTNIDWLGGLGFHESLMMALFILASAR